MPQRRSKRRWLAARGRSLEITASGWLFIGLTLLVGFAAINSGANLLHAVFGAMLALIIGSGVLSEATVRRVDARRFVAGPIHAGVPAALIVEVTGNDPRDVLAVSVEDHEDQADEDGWCDPAFAVRVPGRGSVRLRGTASMPRRGPGHLPPAVIATRFPFGLFVKRRALAVSATVLVYPRLVPVSEAELNAQASGEHSGAARRARVGEFFGLREYREGDDPRRMHWPAVARLGRPVMREMESDGGQEAVVQFPEGTAGDPAFEAAIERAASQAVAHMDRGRRVALWQRGVCVLAGAHGAAHRRRVLDHLAWAGFAHDARDEVAARG